MNHKKFAIKLALQAGKIIKKNFTLNMQTEYKKGDFSSVTKTDYKINDLVIQSIEKYFPSHSVLAEEKSNLKDSEYVWVCDPVDGTIAFAHGFPLSTFSLALVKNGEPILGVAYDPFQKRLFFAEKGKGTYLNNKKINVPQINNFEGSVGAFEMWNKAKYDVFKLAEYLEMNKIVKTVKLCSIVNPSVLVSNGELLFTIFPHTTAHDAAAIKIIVEEAGGRFTDIFGNEQRYDKSINGFIASNGMVHDKLVELSKKLVTINKSS